MRILYLILIASFCISGCINRPAYHAETISNPNNGAIYIYRDAMFKGSAAKPSVFIDGKYFGLLSVGGYIRAEVQEGNHTIEIGNKSKQGLMGWGLDPYFFQAKVSQAESKYLKFMMDDSDYHVSIMQIGVVSTVSTTGKTKVFLAEKDNSQAEIEIAKCKKIILYK